MYTCKHCVIILCYNPCIHANMFAMHRCLPLIFVTPMEINVTRLSDNALRGPHVFCITCSSSLYTLYIHIYTHIYIYIYIYIRTYIYIHTFTIYILYISYHYSMLPYTMECWLQLYIYIYPIYIIYIPYILYIPLDHYRCWRIWQTLCTHDSWEADPSCLLPHIPRTFCLTMMQIIHIILLCILILNTNYTCNITL